ncbi:hypothetical protein [Paenibacillus lautus]|uniref:hypothetical protein n=1 Tax=Paenibacillus lautus TaxID=1401 RepID=UPI001FE793A6|nr:hypothetical protein [Paenibacillus lautus]
MSSNGKFDDLSPIADCIRLDTLVLNCAIDQLDFVVDLPLMKYLAVDSCTLNASLHVLADSNISMLRLSAVRNLTNIDALAAWDHLAFLHLSLPKVERLCDFSHMRNLRQLELDYMKSLQEIKNLWTADKLEVLMLKEIHRNQGGSLGRLGGYGLPAAGRLPFYRFRQRPDCRHPQANG